jgi:hypothetical protein
LALEVLESIGVASGMRVLTAPSHRSRHLGGRSLKSNFVATHGALLCEQSAHGAGMRKSVFAVLLLVLSSPLLAQNTPAAARPDSLGAHFDHTQPGVGTPDGFDFLLGEWTFLFQSRNGPNQWSAPIRGTWKAAKTSDGLVVEDSWRLDSSTEPTLSWRVFNPSRRLWEMQGLKARRGSWDPGLAWGSGDERFVVQTFTGVSQARIKYHRIARDSFSWRADVSIDGGKTWTRDAWLLEAVRVNH